jgi:hypothetical protein
MGTSVCVNFSYYAFNSSARGLNEDLEDNFVLAAFERAHVDYLVTSDCQLRQKATVPALAPKDMTALLEARV